MTGALPALLSAAAANNALWCDTICRIHGHGGRFSQHHWVYPFDAPPLYPNAVTLGDSSSPAIAAQLGAIDRLMDASLSAGWAVKDSFRALDLSSRRFELLFEAVWIGRDAGIETPGDDRLRMTIVRDGKTLAEWEAAWRCDPAQARDELPARLFPDRLLDDPDIVFLASIRDERIVAGAAANRGSGVVGITNLFCGAEPVERVWAGGVAMLSRRHPGLPIVGYEPADRMELLQTLGFGVLAPLAVWLAPG